MIAATIINSISVKPHWPFDIPRPLCHQ